MTVGIIGAGITGLALAHHLDGTETEYVVLEADDQPGGVIRSGRVDGYLLEWGPQRLRRTGPVDELVTDLGLDGEVIEAGDTKLFVYADGDLRRAPFTIEEFGHTDLLSWRGKLDVLKEPQTAPADPEETAAEMFTRKFGEEAYENLIGPLFGGTYGSLPERMPVKHSLSGVLRMEEKYGDLLTPVLKRAMAGGSSAPAMSFEEGVQQLPTALYEAHRENVHLETPVTGIREDGAGYVLETDDESFEVDDVVVTTPAEVSADLLAPLTESADALRRLNYNPLAFVHLRADSDRDGFGYQVRHDEDLDTLGVSWNASMFGRTGRSDDGADEAGGVYTVFLGGMKKPELLEESDETLGDIGATEFAEVMGTGAEVLSVNKLDRGFPAYDASWDALEEFETPDGIHLATNYTARMGVPSRIREAKALAERFAE
ncbi:protoporphyrinogen oxidase [Haladaptatus paucihalophilus DX253]|uniref:Protoporphyrinogen oxidase n=1 Tax=Haladaptatus paucihalophilus DX253 TaxID=797209 RepID=E7QPI2_HALPU|nr:protoporphyrinogen oxidase [Haladaptatus paucihalophilus]EFW93465.1 protoporphyrinogen oxidase [Haladaptatus paucihalophilus DX253]SHL19938.1 oxygen-dependent protoporphyrinogen oxidase [Haladaptatus paucihalophilus DX253]